MKSFCGLFLVLVLTNSSSGDGHIRQKRFFNTLWPSEEVKSDVNDGLIYSQLPPEYLYLLPGVNDHKIFQRRTGVQPQSPALPQPQPARFVHPTRMAILMPPKPIQPQIKTPATNVQPLQPMGPRVVMKPIVAIPNLNPSLMLKTKEQSLPDIHKNNRFVQSKPVQRAPPKPFNQPFNTQQQLPIKKSFETVPALVSTIPILSVKSAPIEDFYFTKEFQDLLREFQINVEIEKLPAINDVMAILGTTNPEDTLESIREVAQSKEGMELIKGYLDQNNDDDQFYNYDDDVGAGEIRVDGTEDVPLVQNYQGGVDASQQTYHAPVQAYRIPQPVLGAPAFLPNPPRPSTTGTLTGTGSSWWKPTTWFGSQIPTKVGAIKTDGEIFQKIVRVPTSGSAWSNIKYIGNFLRPASKDSVPIIPTEKSQISRTFFASPTFTPQNIGQSLPTVRMTEEQFQDMVKALRLTPMNPQVQKSFPAPHQQVSASFVQPSINVNKQLQPQRISSEIPSPAQEIRPTSSVQNDFTPIEAPKAQVRFQAPINVQPLSQGIPLPSTFTQFDNRRNFISVSQPQRATPYDFVATGRVHQANPDEVSKRSRSLAEAIEGKKKLFL